MKDAVNYKSGVNALAAALRTTSVNGPWIDPTSLNGGNNGLTFFAQNHGITDGTHTVKLQDSIDGGTTPVDVAAPYVITPSGQSNALTSASTTGQILKFGYLGNPSIATISASAGYPVSNPSGQKVLVRLVCTVTGGPSTGGTVSGLAVLDYPVNQPAV